MSWKMDLVETTQGSKESFLNDMAAKLDEIISELGKTFGAFISESDFFEGNFLPDNKSIPQK